ncbi:MAG: nucleotide sugar dehydrogenase [Actinomycetota bacterium]|nr:nucleotide sugar dehydrogenase [Actinomycetota bacterium]MDQ6945459.1 nucleotide sugar dehydrogenase [Actinomycetota bacterium]
MKVAVFGLGYVGTVTSACLAAHGHDVWGVDPDRNKVGLVSAGRSPVVEPGLEPLIAKAVAGGSLHATCDPVEAVAGADISLICVGTPSAPDGSTELSYLKRVVTDIGRALAATGSSRPGFHSVVVRSTVPPGTVEGVVAPALEAELGDEAGSHVGVAMCPEFLREGTSVADFFDPPFTVAGTVDRSVADALDRLFGFLDRPLRVVPVRTAEGLKYACNAFHATKVAFSNEVARLYRHLGVDAREVMDLFCQDSYLNISPRYLRPGFAFGGSCLPKDLRSLLYLGRINSIDLPLLSGTLYSNELSVRQVVDRVITSPGRKVALLGLGFKAETDDLRESPSVELAERLSGKGYDLSIYDPVIQPARLVGANRGYVESKLPHLSRLLTDSAAEALAGCDVAVVSVHARCIVSDLLADPPPMVIDLCGDLGPAVEALAGYEGIGW